VGQVVVRNWGESCALPPAPPTITVQPQYQILPAGGSVALSVEGTSPDPANYPLAYQWQKDGAAIPGATNATLTLAGFSTNEVGWYTVLVSNGFTTSSRAVFVGLGDVLALDVELLAGLTITGLVGETYRVEYTTDLNEPHAWHPLTTLVLPTSPYRYLLDSISAGPKRFYRAVQTP
jgi:hypothetical protein